MISKKREEVVSFYWRNSPIAPWTVPYKIGVDWRRAGEEPGWSITSEPTQWTNNKRLLTTCSCTSISDQHIMMCHFEVYKISAPFVPHDEVVIYSHKITIHWLLCISAVCVDLSQKQCWIEPPHSQNWQPPCFFTNIIIWTHFLTNLFQKHWCCLQCTSGLAVTCRSFRTQPLPP